MRYSDILGLTYNEIKARGRKFEQEAFQTLKSVAKKRFKNIEKAGLIQISPAIHHYGFGDIMRALSSSKNISDAEKRTRYFILKRFLKAETSTLRETKRYVKKLEEMLEIPYTRETEEAYTKIFDIVRFIEDNYDIFNYIYGSTNTIKTVANVYRSDSYNFNDLLKDIAGNMSVDEVKKKYGI